MMIPSQSPLGGDTLLAVLQRARNLLEQVRSIIAFVGVFINEVDDLANVLNNIGLSVAKADQIPDLNDLDLRHYPNFPAVYNVFRNDIEWEDEISSLLFFGPPGRRLRAYNARNFSNSEGEIHVTVGRELAARVWDLHSASPGALPSTAVTVPAAPSGCRGVGCYFWSGHQITTFGDEFSSLKLT
jgi:hypothetical protein